jgi:hypothetical protein
MEEENIQKGCILLARCVLDSEIWYKKAEYFKIFMYILLKVNYKENNFYPRGTNFFNFSSENIPGISKNQIYAFIKWAKSEKVKLITTQKTTRGVVIKVNNYDTYQDIETYKKPHELRNTSETTTKQKRNEIDTINNKGIKEERKKETTNIKGGSKDIFINPDYENIFKIYKEECSELIPLSFERRNKQTVELLYNFLKEIDYDFEKFRQICKKGNETKTIANKKIDFKSLINNYIGILNGKYLENSNKRGLSNEEIHDFFKNRRKNGTG